jgi:hypothetical protein
MSGANTISFILDKRHSATDFKLIKPCEVYNNTDNNNEAYSLAKERKKKLGSASPNRPKHHQTS